MGKAQTIGQTALLGGRRGALASANRRLEPSVAEFIPSAISGKEAWSRLGTARKPDKRSDIPPRDSDNDNRRLLDAVDQSVLALLKATINYAGHPKHKRNPHLFGLERYNGKRGDETLCDKHADFTKAKMITIPGLLQRGLEAELVGDRIIWSVADDGWIFEARLTNRDTNEFHGYPVRPSEAIAELVFKRFANWARRHGKVQEKLAVLRCTERYGFEP